jgi:penicillin-binding protein 2
LKMGIDGIQKMVSMFDLNRRTGIDLPHELVSWTPSPEFKKRFNPRDPDWRDIDTVYASFGQVYDFVTPIALLRTIAGIAVGGKLYVPHLLKEVKETAAVGDPNDKETFRPLRPARTFEPLDASRPNPKIVQIADDNHQHVVEGMWQVVNNGGTGTAVKMEGLDIAGKTGTAQVVSLGKDVGANKDHSWFVSYAPAWKPEIATVALIENVGFGGKFAAPATRQMYEAFYHKETGEAQTGTQVAQNTAQRSKARGQAKPIHN